MMLTVKIFTLHLTCLLLGTLAIPANAALLGRAPATPGGTDYRAYYDTVLDITWMADADLAATETFGVPGISPAGAMSWDTAHQWLGAMNANHYLGGNQWRLPKLSPVNQTALNTNYSDQGDTDVGLNISAPGTLYAGSTAHEMAHLYFNTLGNPKYPAIFQNSGPFQHVGPGQGNLFKWYRTEYPIPGAPNLFAFAMEWADSHTMNRNKTDTLGAWAVHPGDIAAVPLPATVWLMGSAITGMMAGARKPKAD